MKHLRLFGTEAEYNAAKAEGLAQPNVAYVEEGEKVIYNGEASESEEEKNPVITINMQDSYGDVGAIGLYAQKNADVEGDIVWTCNLDAATAEINEGVLTFKKHYEGNVTVTATADNATASHTFTVACDETVVNTTYEVGTVTQSKQEVEAGVTSIVVNFVGKTIQHYQKKEDTIVPNNYEETVTFEENTTTEDITRTGSFEWNGITIEWSVVQKGKAGAPAGGDYEEVDLDLPSGRIWAACNVGATKPEEAGLYFAWGATEGAGSDTSDGKVFDWAHSPYPQSGSIPSTLDAEHDAATVNMGGAWHMPDKADIDELISNTTNAWTTVNGVNGRLFTSKSNGKTLFIPAAGYRSNAGLYDVGSNGSVWSRSINSGNTGNAWYLDFDNGGRNTYNDRRFHGFSVRGVR